MFHYPSRAQLVPHAAHLYTHFVRMGFFQITVTREAIVRIPGNFDDAKIDVNGLDVR